MNGATCGLFPAAEPVVKRYFTAGFLVNGATVLACAELLMSVARRLSFVSSFFALAIHQMHVLRYPCG